MTTVTPRVLTLQGARLRDLMAQAQDRFGHDVILLNRRDLLQADGTTMIEIMVSDRPLEEFGVDDFRQLGGHPARCAFRPERSELARRPSTSTEPMVIALIGTAGAGKTSTSLKLALHDRLFGRQRVAFACLDTYRHGALDQLEGYASLGNVPVVPIYDLQDIARLRQLKPKPELIIVDTPGRSERQRDDLEATRTFLNALRPHETHLVVPAGMQPGVIRAHVARHAPLGVTHLLVTKLDDAPDDWTPFEVATDLGLAVRWMTDGQAIPGDIRSAIPRLTKVLLSRRTLRAAP